MTTLQHRPLEALHPAPTAPVPPTRRLVSVQPARSLGLSDLMLRRGDLAGVHAPADILAEAVLWSV